MLMQRWAKVGLASIMVLQFLAMSGLRPNVVRGGLEGPSAAYQDVIAGDVAAAARQFPGFGGIYFDRSRNGQAVVLLVGKTAQQEAALRLAARGEPLEIAAATHTYSELQEAIDHVWASWRETVGSGAPIAVGLNTIGNSVDVYVPWDEFDKVSKKSERIADVIGTPVNVRGSEPVAETACTDRDHCTYPERAGIVIRRGSPTSTARCTMAFHVRVGSDEQFVTAGHCGYGATQTWYHQGLSSYAMNGTASLYYANGIDMRRINLLDSQASAIIYPNSHPVGGWRWPVVGAWVFVSAGVSNRVVENIVQDDYLTWTGQNCGCLVYGAKMTQTPGGMAGDSGSPVFELGSSKTYAIGTGSGTMGSSDLFARMGDAVNRWGITLVTG